MATKGGSWYGNYGAFKDSQDNNRPASGIPNTTPSIAVNYPDNSTLKGFYLVRSPKGRLELAVHGDAGPAGNRIDINGRLATDFGYTPGNFPTDSPFKYRYLGKNKAAAVLAAKRAGAVVPKEFGGSGAAPAKAAKPKAQASKTAVSAFSHQALQNYLAQHHDPNALLSLALTRNT